MLRCILLLLLTLPAYAVEYITITAGKMGVLDSPDSVEQLGLEYRFNDFGSIKLIPSVGITILNDNSRLMYTDLRHDFYMTDNWILIPSLGVALFDNAHTIDLGMPVEFKTGIELSYEFNNRARLGASFFHLSNGGIASYNPGTETLLISVSLPVGK